MAERRPRHRRGSTPTVSSAPLRRVLILPMSIRCKSCSGSIPKATRFDCRQELLHDLISYGCRIYRLFFNCPVCGHELTMKNSSLNNAYVVDKGSTCSDDVEAALKEMEGLGLGKESADEAMI